MGSEAWSPSISEELRRRAVAPRRRRAEGRYIGAQPILCQHPGVEKSARPVQPGNSNLPKSYRGFTPYLKAPGRRTAATFLRPSCHRFGRCHFGGNCVGVAASAAHGSPNDRARRLGHGPLTDREGCGVPLLQVNASRPRSRLAPVVLLRWTARGGGGDVGLGPGQTTRGIPFQLGSRAHRSRQRACVVGRRRSERTGGPPPRLGPMVQRHHSHRSLRRGADERRRFRGTRWRDQLRHGAGACGSRVARRRHQHHRSRGECDPQDRSSAATRRGQRGAPGHSRVHHGPWKRQPRNRAGAPVHSRRGQSIALGVRAFGQHSRLQCAEDPRQVRGTSSECRRRRRR